MQVSAITQPRKGALNINICGNGKVGAPCVLGSYDHECDDL